MFDKPRLRAAIAVSLGAIAGALCRYYIGSALSQAFGTDFPWGTLGVNLSGCFCMGLVTTLLSRRRLQPEWLLMQTTGFLGSYTTFSAYGLDIAVLRDRPGLISDCLYWLGSPVLGLMGLALGIGTGKIFAPRQPPP